MGRLFLVTPHYCLPIPSRVHDEMEEGLGVRQQPPATQPNPAAWRLFKIFFRWFTAMLSIGMVVSIFVGRHLNLFPELQDPLTVVFLLFIALIQVGFGFMITQGDVETHIISAQEEQHL